MVNPKHQVGYDLKGSTWLATNAITSQHKRKYKAWHVYSCHDNEKWIDIVHS